nr:hypothetical protein [Tanacetum cinerariifolium]
MELSNVGGTDQQDRVKTILMEPKVTYISELSSTDYDKTIEAIVYHKWTSKTTKIRLPTKFCCILIDRQNEMAVNFDEHGYNSMENPVIIAVSSCYINRYHGLQLVGTSATHHYLNQNIQRRGKSAAILKPYRYPQLSNTRPILEIVNERYEDMEREKMRSQFPLAVLREVDPQNYQPERGCNIDNVPAIRQLALKDEHGFVIHLRSWLH